MRSLACELFPFVFAKGPDYAGDIVEMVISPSPSRRNICRGFCRAGPHTPSKKSKILSALRLAWNQVLYHTPP
jgi:hypothetical protein